MINNSPLISIIVINYNGKSFLEHCLTSIQNSNYNNKEIILVDNASKDDSIKYVQSHFKNVQIIRTKKNLGFADAANKGIKYANGEFVTILNEDMYVDNKFLSEVVKYMILDKNIGICGSLVLAPNEIYDGKFRWVPSEVFAVGGGAMTVNKKILKEIQLFDEDYFLYDEDVDFCWRTWLCGYKVFLIPTSIIYHYKKDVPFAQRFNSRYFYFFTKHRFQTLYKNGDQKQLLFNIPLFIATRLLLFFLLSLVGRIDISISIFKGILWNFQHIQLLQKKRLNVHNLFKYSNKELFMNEVIRKSPIFSVLETSISMNKLLSLTK